MKPTLLFSAIMALFINSTFPQSGVSVNTTGVAADPSAIFDASSKTQGLLLPRMTEAERNAISNPAIGLLIYNLTTSCFDVWTGTNWKQACFDCPFTVPVVSTNSPVCEGDSINLNATDLPGATYSWSGPDGFSSTDQNPVINNVTSANAGTYILIVTYNGCSANPISTIVAVNATPATPTASSNSPVCENGTLDLAASTIPYAFYSWSGPNGIFTSSSQNPSISNVGTSYSGTYSVTATVNGCSSNAGTTNVVVNSLPTQASAGADQLNVVGSSVTLNANTPSNGTGQWSVVSGTGGSLGNASSPASTFSGVAGNAYVLQWTISNSLCPDSYDQVNISFANIKKVFITSTGYNGNLSGVSGANTKCQSSATTAGLSGTFKAWISVESGSAPANSFTQSTSPYVLVNNTVVANNWADLTDGTLQNPINIDEYGNSVSSRVWSHTNSNGTFSNANCTNACNNWTTSDSNTETMWGLSTATDYQWTYSSSSGGSYSTCGGEHQCNPCSCSYRLYCFEQ